MVGEDEPAGLDRLVVARGRVAVARDRVVVAREPAEGHAPIVRRRLAGRAARVGRVAETERVEAGPISEVDRAADPGSAVNRISEAGR